jgi:hypothetical protein
MFRVTQTYENTATLSAQSQSPFFSNTLLMDFSSSYHFLSFNFRLTRPPLPILLSPTTKILFLHHPPSFQGLCERLAAALENPHASVTCFVPIPNEAWYHSRFWYSGLWGVCQILSGVASLFVVWSGCSSGASWASEEWEEEVSVTDAGLVPVGAMIVGIFKDAP